MAPKAVDRVIVRTEGWADRDAAKRAEAWVYGVNVVNVNVNVVNVNVC